jgi:fructose-1,6-bisphosphatase/inositol monophosphatase family enzyme
MAKNQQSLVAWVERQVVGCRPVALRYFRSSSLRVERKPDRSPVTAADRTIEERLRNAITRAFPGEAILGEEFGRTGDPTDTYWTVDPIDGTRAFSCGLPTWGIMVGRVERGRATLGVVDFPAIGTTLAVGPGTGAFERVRGRRVILPRARAARSLRDAVIFHGGLRWWSVPRFIRGFQRIVRASYLERAYGDCYGYLWVLRGRADAMIDYGVKPWDLVPFAAIARSTGHLLSDFSGRPSFLGPETVMAHPAFARLICRTLRGQTP